MALLSSAVRQRELLPPDHPRRRPALPRLRCLELPIIHLPDSNPLRVAERRHDCDGGA